MAGKPKPKKAAMKGIMAAIKRHEREALRDGKGQAKRKRGK